MVEPGGGGSKFWDKIVNFWFYDLKKNFVEFWIDQAFQPDIGQFLDVFTIRIMRFLRKFKEQISVT